MEEKFGRSFDRSFAWLGPVLLLACGGRDALSSSGVDADDAGSGTIAVTGGNSGVGGVTPFGGTGGVPVTGAGGFAGGTGGVPVTGGAFGTGGAFVTGGTGGVPATGGVGGSAGGSAGTGGSGRAQCLDCLADACPDAARCFLDEVCRHGMLCAMLTCNDQSPQRFQCFVTCFNGDRRAALRALLSVGCLVQNCELVCSN